MELRDEHPSSSAAGVGRQVRLVGCEECRHRAPGLVTEPLERATSRDAEEQDEGIALPHGGGGVQHVAAGGRANGGVADRGSSMTSRTVAQLLADLGVTAPTADLTAPTTTPTPKPNSRPSRTHPDSLSDSPASPTPEPSPTTSSTTTTTTTATPASAPHPSQPCAASDDHPSHPGPRHHLDQPTRTKTCLNPLTSSAFSNSVTPPL